MGRAVSASKKGFERDEVCERYHAKGSEIQKSMRAVSAASLNDNIKGSKSIIKAHL